MADNINQPHGGTLINLLADDTRAKELKDLSKDWVSLDLNQRQLCDLELLLNGGFSPLTTFMGQADYESVKKDVRLADGTVWPMPINLDVSEEFAKGLQKGQTIALRDPEGVVLAALTVSEIYQPDKQAEALSVFGTTDQAHAGVNYLMNKAGTHYLSGKLEGLQLPTHYDFTEMRYTPAELRAVLKKRDWSRVVAFQTRNPMHRAHVAIAQRAAQEAEANLLIQPTVGMTKPGDIDHFTRVRVYRALQDRFPSSTTMIALLPLAMRMGGPREALWHAIVRKNHGASHFIVGRDHAGPGKDSNGKDFYGPFDSEEFVRKYADEVGITIMPARMMVYVPAKDTYMRSEEVPEGLETATLSGTEQRARLRAGKELPEWFTYPEVVAELRRTTPPRTKQGFTVFFTGLSGSGKSTIANILITKLLELGGRSVSLLDGDIVRKHLSSELGFSREHRDINIQRIGFVASEIAKHGGVAICAPIAPYDATRKAVREIVEGEGGGFILVHVNTPLKICEERDRKGLYKKARAGEIKEFTGISDPYEAPADADVVLDTVKYSAGELVQQVLLHLEHEGYIGSLDA